MKVNKFLASGFATFLLMSFVLINTTKQEPEKIKAEMPANVKTVIENKCFGCHNTDSRNDKAKEKLDFKSFHELKTFKKIGSLRDMQEVLEKGEMPPEKFLERFPDRKLSEEESEIISTWVKEEANNLINSQ